MAEAATTEGQNNTPAQATTSAQAAADGKSATTVTSSAATEGKTLTSPDSAATTTTDKSVTEAKAGDDTTEPAPLELKLPEDVKLDEAAVAKFKELARAQGIPQDKAQALIDFQAEIARTAQAAWQKQIADQHATWRAESQRQFRQGDFDAAKTALAAAADPEINKFLEETKLGDNPLVIRLLSRLGSRFAEDRFEEGGVRPRAQVDAASRLFPLSGPKTN